MTTRQRHTILAIALLVLVLLSCITVEQEQWLEAANQSQQRGLPLATVTGEVEP
jgi:hypothetical protein